MKKKKIVFHSNYHKLFTGFGKNAKNILSYLYKTGKYELIEVANGKNYADPELDKLPWKCKGSLPRPDQFISPEEQNKPDFQKKAAYGFFGIDKIIEEEKPDMYIGAEDVWAFDEFTNKKWWNKINCMVWTTLDSLPILPNAVKAAPKIKHYFTWASFASKALNDKGFPHVKTLNGSLDTTNFFRLNDNDRLKLRQKNSIGEKDFIIGFVFRNQLRKSAPNLLDGFKKFITRNPECNAKLLLHTHWSEGWNLTELIKEKNINPDQVLTTYYCKECKQYEIKKFTGQGIDCKLCNSKNSQATTNITHGVSEKQLNEIYNLMDVYCHPFTSGGMEIPVFEAKLTELMTLVTNYSCGEDSCTSESGGFPLEWNEYREPGTQFIKATTSSASICKQLTKVWTMDKKKAREKGKRAREFVVKNYSIEAIGKKVEEIIDSTEPTDWDFSFEEEPRDPNYMSPPIQDNKEWIEDAYKNILKMEVPSDYQGTKDWLDKLRSGGSREEILHFFRQTAQKENEKINKTKFDDFFTDEDKGRRIGIVIPESAGDVLMINSLIENIQKQYVNHNIYVITNPNFFPLIDSHPNVYKCLPYNKQCDDLLALEGRADHEGYFEIAFLPHVGTQRFFSYHHNGKENIQFELQDF